MRTQQNNNEIMQGETNANVFEFNQQEEWNASSSDMLELENEMAGSIVLPVRKKAVSVSDRPENAEQRKPRQSKTVRSSSGSVRFSGKDSGSTFRASTAEKTEEAQSRSRINDYQKNFDRMVYMPPKVVEFLRRKGMSDPAAVLSRSYMKSIEDQSFEHRGITITFPVSWERGGEGMVAILKRNEKSYGRQWYLTYVGFPKLQEEAEEKEERENHPSDTQNGPDKSLETFADIGYWQELLKELSDLAAPEDWNASNRKLGKNYLLKKYLQFIFARAMEEEKVLISADDSLAAFNTGLLNSHYEDIYACFTPQRGEGAVTPWRFEAFITAGARDKNGLGKKLTSSFDPLPQPVAFCDNPGDMMFDTSAGIEVDCSDLIEDNLRRLPLGFLRESCYGDDDAQHMIENLENARTQNHLKQGYQIFSGYLRENDKLSRRMRTRMEEAVEASLKKVLRYPRLAVPGVNPKTGEICMLLALCLEADQRTDAVLVLAKNEDHVYISSGILTTDHALIYARLLGNPVQDWLAWGREEGPQKKNS